MANIPIWPGSSSFASGSTPFGFYDSDSEFQTDADKFALFASRRLGYPIVDIELQDINFYAAFEEAVTVYGNELYAYKIRENYLTLEGAPSTTDVNNSIITPNLERIIQISQQYGVEAGTGGNVDWRTGSLELSSGVQEYDLNSWAVGEGFNDGDIEIKRIFYQEDPAIMRFFDPYLGSGAGVMNVVDQFGWGGYSPAVNFMLMPINYDLQIIQQIEFNDQIRKSNFSFEVHNNKIRIFPIPSSDGSLWFHFLLKSDRISSSFADGTGKVTNVGNVPYENPNYTQINSVGRSWVFEYALALCKEILGYVRGKYSQIPIPGDNVQLNSNDLITSATSDKDKLIERLRTYLGETSRDKLMERRSQETEFRKKELNEIPFPIYIG